MSTKTPGKRGIDPSGKKGQWNKPTHHQTILRIPKRLYLALKENAEDNHRSVNAEVVSLLLATIGEMIERRVAELKHEGEERRAAVHRYRTWIRNK